VTKLTITAADIGRRLDKFLMAYLKGATRSFIYKLLRKKRIKLNGKRAEGGELLKDGDAIEFYLSQDTLDNCRKSRDDIYIANGATPRARYPKHAPDSVSHKARQDGDIVPVENAASIDTNLPQIVYEDDNLLIINKPAGMASHGGMKSKVPHLLARVLAYLQQKGDYPPGATFTPALCNRLDVNTSGLIICGKNYQALRAVNNLFATPGAIEKQYLAIVEGELTGSATLEGHYNKDTATNTACITQSSKPPQAITQYASIAVSNDSSLVSVSPITGRSHQIRAHLAAIGHPLLGDKKYGGRVAHKAPGQLLHCHRLRLTKPLLNYPINTTWTAEPPKEFCGNFSEVFTSIKEF